MNQENDNQEKVKKASLPLVTVILIAVNIAVYLAVILFSPDPSVNYFTLYGGMYPPAVRSGQWYRLFTCIVLHANTGHLLNNTIMLFALGYYVEPALKRIKFLILYILSGFFGSLASCFLGSGDYVSVGASGAIFGLMGALVWIMIRNRGRYAQLRFRGLLIMLALSVYYGFATAGIDNFAHLGGLISGFLLSIVLYRYS